MISIKFTPKSGDPIAEILNDIKLEEENIKNEFNALGAETARKMRTVINENKVRPQADEPTALENTIGVEYFENGWGVGDVEKLKQQAPGWAAINFGSSHMVGKQLPVGVFNPGEPAPNTSFFRAGRFKKGEKYNNESYAPIVNKPIPPMNYIEKTVFWLSQEFNKLRGIK